MKEKFSERKGKVAIDFIISTLNRGGAENKLVAVANGINQKLYSVRVIVLKNGPLTASLEVEHVENIIPSKYCFSGVIRLFALLSSRRPSIVWVVGNGDAGFWGRILAKFAFVPIIIQSIHATERVGGKPTIDPLNRFLDRMSLFTTKYIGVAKAHVAYLVKKEGIKEEKIECIYNGVDVSKFKTGKPDLVLMQKLTIPQGSTVIGMVARFKREKRHMLFLDAAKILADSNTSLHFLLVGDGPLEESIRKHVKHLGLDNRVHFAGGVDDVTSYYHLMNVLVLCSNSVEAFPNVVLEAMASGIPVVSTDVGSVKEVVIDGVSGVLVPQDDVSALCNGIQSILKNDKLRSAFTENALAAIYQKYTLKTMIEKRENLFNRLLRERNES